jgi:uncharacterized membrane protein HdeD (DUF308 family)
MAVSANEVRQQWAWITGLRGVLMIIAGLYAVFSPGAALTVLVIVGGALILIDGVLGLWSLTFGGGKSGNYWFDVIRNVLAIVLGVLILLSPVMATLLTATFLVYLFAIQAIIVGVMEIVVILRERDSYARIWPVLLSGALYVIFGVALLFMPLIGALTMVIFGGVLAILFGVALIGFAWRLYQRSKGTPAAT